MYPVRLGVGNVYSASYVTANVAGSTTPPFALNVIVYSFAVHCAVSSASSARCHTPSAISSSPRHQPANVYPVRLGVGNVYSASYVTANVADSTTPPFASNVIVYSFAVHCALYSLLPTLPTGMTTVSVGAVRSVPVQPINVYPARSGAAKTISSLSTVYAEGFDDTSCPPFSSYVMVYSMQVVFTPYSLYPLLSKSQAHKLLPISSVRAALS